MLLVVSEICYVPSVLSEGLQCSPGVVRGDVCIFFGVWFKGFFDAVGMVVPSFGLPLRDDDRVFVLTVWAACVCRETFSFEEGFPCNRFVGLLPWTCCDEDIAVY